MRLRLSAAGALIMGLILPAMCVAGNLASLIPPPPGAKVAMPRMRRGLRMSLLQRKHERQAAKAENHPMGGVEE